jgi:hypothetical protein
MEAAMKIQNVCAALFLVATASPERVNAQVIEQKGPRTQLRAGHSWEVLGLGRSIGIAGGKPLGPVTPEQLHIWWGTKAGSLVVDGDGGLGMYEVIADPKRVRMARRFLLANSRRYHYTFTPAE